MRFAFIFDGLGCGGIERVGVDYCNALAQRGHEVTAINLDPMKNDFVSQLSDSVAYVTRKFPRELAPERYCTLVKRAVWGRFIYPFAYALCSAGVFLVRPYVRRAFGHFDVAIAFSGHYNDLTFVSSGCVEANEKIAWLHGAISSYALISAGYLNLYKHFDGLVCLCDDGIEEFKFANSYLDFRVKKIYNPISLGERNHDKKRAEELYRQYGDFALMVARLDYPHKDPFTVIDAIDLVNSQYGFDLKLVIVGDGPDRNRIERYIDDHNMGSKVFLVGYQSDPTAYFAASKLFIHASAGSEGLPTVMLEAMAFKKPVIATDVRTGPKEILGYNEFGLLCKPMNPVDMARQIYTLLSDEELYKYYSDRSSERIKDFSTEEAIDGVITFVGALKGPATKDNKAVTWNS